MYNKKLKIDLPIGKKTPVFILYKKLKNVNYPKIQIKVTSKHLLHFFDQHKEWRWMGKAIPSDEKVIVSFWVQKNIQCFYQNGGFVRSLKKIIGIEKSKGSTIKLAKWY